MLNTIRLENFTAFEDLELRLAAGINAFIGANGTGKTHLMKVAYAACEITKSRRNFADKLEKVFQPFESKFHRLLNRGQLNSTARIAVTRDDGATLSAMFSNRTATYENVELKGASTWLKTEMNGAFIPVKDMLANAPGFRSLNKTRELHFEEIYTDIIDLAFLPKLKKDAISPERAKLLGIIQKAMDGKIVNKNEEFFLEMKNRKGNLEFSLLAEGFRKLALLWLLIQNGTLQPGSILFWDEPEANLSPKLVRIVVEVLLALQRQGVQIMIATHDYIFLKWLELLAGNNDQIAFHAFQLGKTGVRHETFANFRDAVPNDIDSSYADLYQFILEQSMQ